MFAPAFHVIARKTTDLKSSAPRYCDGAISIQFQSGSSDNSWKPAMPGTDTTTASYWLNWRVFLCSFWVLLSLSFALLLIKKYGAFCNPKQRDEEGQTRPETARTLYDDETWSPCLKGVHPAWLLAFRVLAFFLLLVMLTATVVIDGASIYYYYTQWTSTLITIYFGLGSLLSASGCRKYHRKRRGGKLDNSETASEKGNFVASNTNGNKGTSASHGEPIRETAGVLGHFFHIIFQMNAGAVVLTDSVFWCIIVPLLAVENYRLRFLDINMHSINVILLLGDTALNCLWFPLSGIAYFFLWTVVYVVFQWLVHACVTIWWPYPFLDLSPPLAPLWYFAVAMMHFPCYGIFALVVKLKHTLLGRWFPQSYQCGG